jgi:hypothetical protein
MGLLFEILISLSFSIHSYSDYKSFDKINSITYNVFKDNTRKTLLLIMSILNYTFLAALIALAIAEIGSQSDFDNPARSIAIIQLIINILVYISVIPISYFKRSNIVRELIREFEHNRQTNYTYDELYEYISNHIVVTKKELSKMLRSIKSKP